MADPNQLTRKERREQARREREAREAEARAREQRTRRMWQVGGALVLAAAIVIALVVISTSGGGSGPTGLAKGKQANQTATSVTSLLSGIPQSGNTLGNPSARVTMQYYGDLQCPVCRDFTLGTLPQLISQDVRPGRVRVQYRSLETATSDTSIFELQQVAALAAGKQNKMWDYVELFYHEQGQEGTGYVNESFLTGIAQQVPGLNLSAWHSARSSSALTDAVAADQQAANQKGYNATPTLEIDGPKGSKVESGLVPYSTLASDIQAVS